MNTPTDKTDSPEQADLKALYERHGQVEPDAGLDRMIQARADEAVSQPARSRALPWMGGLATAAVLVIAIGVIFQIQPPVSPPFAPEADSQFMSDQNMARPAPAPALESPQQDRMRVAPSSRAEQEGAARAQSLGESAPMEAGQAAEELDRVTVSGSRLRYARESSDESEKSQVSPDAEQLQAVADAMENEEFEQARNLLEALAVDHPDHPMVKSLEERLSELDPE